MGQEFQFLNAALYMLDVFLLQHAWFKWMCLYQTRQADGDPFFWIWCAEAEKYLRCAGQWSSETGDWSLMPVVYVLDHLNAQILFATRSTKVLIGENLNNISKGCLLSSRFLVKFPTSSLHMSKCSWVIYWIPDVSSACSLLASCFGYKHQLNDCNEASQGRGALYRWHSGRRRQMVWERNNIEPSMLNGEG